MLTKQYSRQVLFFCFNWKKSAVEAHRMVVKVYGDNAQTDKSCIRRKKSNYYSRLSSSYYSNELNVRNRYELLPVLASTRAFLA